MQITSQNFNVEKQIVNISQKIQIETPCDFEIPTSLGTATNSVQFFFSVGEFWLGQSQQSLLAETGHKIAWNSPNYK